MFEARLVQGSLLKKIIEAIKDLVTDVNIDCQPESGLTLQAMDSSHVSLVTVNMKSEGFDFYRCDKPTVLGINTITLSKILKCAGNDDIITLKKMEDTDTLTLIFESPTQDKISEFEIKLMQIESEQLGIPDTEYKCNVRMPANDLQRIVRDLQVLGDTCAISVSKEAVKFSSNGDIGSGTIIIKHKTNVDKDDDAVVIYMEENVDLNFALRYLSSFTKATSLGPTVTLSMSSDIPMVVEYPIDTMGHVKYYLAPKIDEDA